MVTDRPFHFEADGQTLRCPVQEGAFRTAVLPLEDVILSEAPIQGSIQNAYRGTVRSVRQERGLYRVALDCGFAIETYETDQSVTQLQVAVGKTFHVAFKASAVRLY